MWLVRIHLPGNLAEHLLRPVLRHVVPQGDVPHQQQWQEDPVRIVADGTCMATEEFLEGLLEGRLPEDLDEERPGVLGHIGRNEVLIKVLLPMPSQTLHKGLMPVAPLVAVDDGHELRLVCLHYIRPGPVAESLEAGSDMGELWYRAGLGARGGARFCLYDGARIRPFDGAGFRPCDEARIRPCDGAGFRPYDGARIRPFDGAGFRPCDGARIRPCARTLVAGWRQRRWLALS